MTRKQQKAISSILLSFSGASYADEIANQTNTTLNEIQVIANKTNNSSISSINYRESGNIIPTLVTASPSDTEHTTAQELNNLAGVSILGSSQSISQNISIGGLSDNNIIVGIDGLNNYFSSFGHNQTVQLISPFLFKQVTATQTGSDITFGSGNIGGAVNFTTLDPEDMLHGDKISTQAALGANSATTGTTANAALAARSGAVSYLLDVVANNNNDMQLGNTGSLPYSANTNFQGLAKIGVDISKTQNFKLSFLGMQNQGQYPAVITNTVTATNPASNFNFQQTQTTADYSYTPGNQWIDFKAKAFYQTSLYQATPLTNGKGFAYPQNINVNTNGLKLQNTTTIIQQRLLYGLEYTNIQGNDSYNTALMVNYPAANQQLYGAFLQDSWDITKKINLTLGSRYNGYQSQSSSLSNSGSLFTNQASLNYHFLPDWLAFIGYSEGFQAPTIQQLYLGGDHPYAGPQPFLTVLPNPNLAAEVAHNKTIGMKYDTSINAEQHLSVSATGFLNNVSNYILNSYVGTSPSGTALNQNINISEAQLYGYILALNYTSPWIIVDSNFTSTIGTTQSNYYSERGELIPSGSALPIPQAKGYLGLGFPIQAISSTITATMNYALTQSQTPVNVPEVPSYTLYGLAYSYQPKGSLKGMQVSAGIDNILNENYWTYNGQAVFPGMGRNVYGQIAYKY